MFRVGRKGLSGKTILELRPEGNREKGGGLSEEQSIIQGEGRASGRPRSCIVMKVERRGFAEGLDTECERNRRSQGWCQSF